MSMTDLVKVGVVVTRHPALLEDFEPLEEMEAMKERADFLVPELGGCPLCGNPDYYQGYECPGCGVR